MDSVVHFELPAKDPKRASAFYSKAFGWQFSQYPDFEYWRIGTTVSDKDGVPTSPGAINGGMGKKGGALKVLTVTIGVANIDATLKGVSKLGGKVVVKKQAITGGMGFTAYFSDTEGNVIGLYQYPER
ncbi:MAG: VOC family protein [Nitrososphaerales archaeon]